MISIDNRHHVSEPEPVEAKPPYDAKVEELNIAIAEIGIVAADARPHDGRGNKMRHRHHASDGLLSPDPIGAAGALSNS